MALGFGRFGVRACVRAVCFGVWKLRSDGDRGDGLMDGFRRRIRVPYLDRRLFAIILSNNIEISLYSTTLNLLFQIHSSMDIKPHKFTHKCTMKIMAINWNNDSHHSPIFLSDQS